MLNSKNINVYRNAHQYKINLEVRPVTLLKRDSGTGVFLFSVIFAKFLRTIFFTENLRATSYEKNSVRVFLNKVEDYRTLTQVLLC